MNSLKKINKKNIVFSVVAILLVVLLIALPFILEFKQNNSENKASILSAMAEFGTICKTLSGTGTITEQEASEVSVPGGVKVTEYLVENGQFIKAGDPVAIVDKTSVMETISTVHGEMDDLAAEIESVRCSSDYTYISAPASGRVKAVYASPGDSVQQVVLQHGTLAVLSLDGLMSLDFRSAAPLAIGQSVSVLLSDGTVVPGRVETIVDEEATVTLSDQYGKIGESVTVQSSDGQVLGYGTLSVHSAWNAIATGGTISNVSVKEESTVSVYGTLFVLTGTDAGGEYEQLVASYQDYENTMADLFLMYQDGYLKSPCDGCVSGADEDILKLLSASTVSSPSLVFLTSINAPPDNQSVDFTNQVGIVSDTADNTAYMQVYFTEITDYSDTSSVNTAADSFKKKETFSSVPIYQWVTEEVETEQYDVFTGEAFEEDVVYYELSGSDYSPTTDLVMDSNKTYYIKSTVTVLSGNWAETTAVKGGIYLFTYDGSGSLVWMVYVGNGQLPSEDTGKQGKSNKAAGGGTAGSGNAVTEEEEAVISETTILSVTPQETVTVSITVDELDILFVHTGQEATVTLDAFPGQAFPGVITEVNTAATNEGGNSKYTAVVQLDRNGYMLAGMNASANITIEERENVLLVPAEALDEENGSSILYTSYDEKSGALTNPSVVTTGLSDGNRVQILSGLEEGCTVWYSYYDTLEIAGFTGRSQKS